MTDIAQKITDAIIEQLEQGTAPWQKPWISGNGFPFALPKNATTGKHYRGINIPLLWMANDSQKFTTGEWASYKQWQGAGENVAQGQKGTMIIYYDTFEKEQEDGDLKKVPFIKSSYVFNRCQLVSYNQETAEPKPERKPLVERIATVDEFLANTKAVVHHRLGGACYVPAQDVIYMPHEEDFVATTHSTATENYYSVRFHETAHWTGHKDRCNRDLKGRFGSQYYAFEELVAELSAAFLCAGLEITHEPRPDHASYLASWLQVLKNDKRAILTAASEASKVMDYLQGLQPSDAQPAAQSAELVP